MNINFTIVIQAINFFIGFLLLKYLLFKPALQYLQSEEKKKNNMSKKIFDQEELLNQKIEIKSDNWKTCQKYFSKTCPSLEPLGSASLEKLGTPHAALQDQKEPEHIDVSEQEIKELTKHVENALTERLQHVKN